ncbi:MAG TPA: hypothetical protein VFC84_01940 [Desulfosporosinus sp.]|nr:hypothetical protein [Desulfosporosinus sp.]
MKLKIHNKKGFWGGAFLLLLAVFYIPTLMNNITDMDTTMRIGKTILIITACALFGVTGVYRGINSKCAKEDAQEDDERKKLVDIKTKSSAFIVTFLFSIFLALVLAISIGITKNNNFTGIFVGVGIMPTIMIIAYICANIYQNKRN